MKKPFPDPRKPYTTPKLTVVPPGSSEAHIVELTIRVDKLEKMFATQRLDLARFFLSVLEQEITELRPSREKPSM
jgi:hypothetical protein